MKAIIMLDDGAGILNNSPDQSNAREAANSCISMGISVIYHKSFASAPTTVTELEYIIARTGAELVIEPINHSGNRNTFINISINGLSVPLFILGANQASTANLKGHAGYYSGDTSSTSAQGQVDGNIIHSYNRRYNLASYTAPENAIAIATGLAANGESDAIIAWKYTPDGVKWIYHENMGATTNTLHLLVQQAINDEQMEAPPFRAPQILSIDHIGNGEIPNPGTTGTQLQPEIITTLGDILRGSGGIAYASIEQNNVSAMNATQIAFLVEYSDVFRYIASHDHSGLQTSNSGYTTSNSANAALDSQETKAAIDGSYQATKTAIESLGLTVSTDLAILAGNQAGDNFWQLATPNTSVLADVAGITPKAGYGFKSIRPGATVNNGETYPGVDETSGHWLSHNIMIRNIRLLGLSRDAGSDNGNVIDLLKDYQAFRNNTWSHVYGRLTYHHDNDFEEPISGAISSGEQISRGVLSWQYGAAYANFCKNTVKFGADVNDYI